MIQESKAVQPAPGNLIVSKGSETYDAPQRGESDVLNAQDLHTCPPTPQQQDNINSILMCSL